MRAGTPLTDADRWDWLQSLRQAATAALSTPSASSPDTPQGVVVTCSALKRKYRDVMRVAPYNDPRIKVHFLFLSAPEDVLLARTAARQGHFMGACMVKSQLAALEAPAPDERDALVVDCSAGREQVGDVALRLMSDVMAQQERDADRL